MSMNKEDEDTKEKSLFIERRPVKWGNLTDEEHKDLDFLADMMTDEEINTLQVLISGGPKSKRAVWNKYCEKISELESLGVDPTGLSDSDYYKAIRAKLSQQDINFPSYHTIENTLETLKNNGILTTRPSNKGNTGDLYLVNPRFKKAWEKRRNEIKAKNQWLSSSDRVIEFYLINKDKEIRNEAYNY